MPRPRRSGAAAVSGQAAGSACSSVASRSPASPRPGALRARGLRLSLSARSASEPAEPARATSWPGRRVPRPRRSGAAAVSGQAARSACSSCRFPLARFASAGRASRARPSALAFRSLGRRAGGAGSRHVTTGRQRAAPAQVGRGGRFGSGGEERLQLVVDEAVRADDLGAGARRLAGRSRDPAARLLEQRYERREVVEREAGVDGGLEGSPPRRARAARNRRGRGRARRPPRPGRGRGRRRTRRTRSRASRRRRRGSARRPGTRPRRAPPTSGGRARAPRRPRRRAPRRARARSASPRPGSRARSSSSRRSDRAPSAPRRRCLPPPRRARRRRAARPRSARAAPARPPCRRR